MINFIKTKIVNTGRWIKRQVKWILLIIFGIGGVMAADIILPDPVPPHIYQVVNWEKPTTDAGWAEDVKKENFNVKHYYQLEQMEENLTEKSASTFQNFSGKKI